jgi:DNA-binding GntR family transcriptional regulator
MHEAIAPHIQSFLVAFAQVDTDRAAAINRNRQLANAIAAGNPKVAAQLAREHLVPCLKTLTTVAKKMTSVSA